MSCKAQLLFVPTIKHCVFETVTRKARESYSIARIRAFGSLEKTCRFLNARPKLVLLSKNRKKMTTKKNMYILGVMAKHTFRFLCLFCFVLFFLESGLLSGWSAHSQSKHIQSDGTPRQRPERQHNYQPEPGEARRRRGWGGRTGGVHLPLFLSLPHCLSLSLYPSLSCVCV